MSCHLLVLLKCIDTCYAFFQLSHGSQSRNKWLELVLVILCQYDQPKPNLELTGLGRNIPGLSLTWSGYTLILLDCIWLLEDPESGSNKAQ
jgi:hypothetical protein